MITKNTLGYSKDNLVANCAYINTEQQVGRKFDKDKPRYSLIPSLALEEVVHVLTYGSQKYEDFNWKYVDQAEDRYFSAANRHLWQWKRGEKLDEETKRNHLASVITNLMFILELELEKEQKNNV